jgi:hypothetical protein
MKFWAVVALAIIISDGIKIVGDLSAWQTYAIFRGSFMCGNSAAVSGDDHGRLSIRNDKHVGLK